MKNEHQHRGGSFTIEQLDAEAAGQSAAAQKIAREANPYQPGSDLAGFWDRAHCRLSGVDPSAKTERVAPAAKPAQGKPEADKK